MIVRLSKIAFTVVAVLLVGGVSAYLTLTLLIKGEATVVVPDLAGQDAVTVLQRLSDLGLNTKIGGSEFSDTVPENLVLHQDPEAGSAIKSGRTVQVILSRGVATRRMPDLTGLPAREAALVAEEKGLCPGVRSYTPHPTVEADHVIAQSPPSGAEVRQGICTDLLISQGQEPTAHGMPDLAGVNIREATRRIERYRLSLGRITPLFRGDLPLETVVEQEPAAGHRVEEGHSVLLTVNRKPGHDPTQPPAHGFIHHRVPPGYLNRHVRLEMDGFGISGNVYDHYLKPGQEVWLLVPTDGRATARLYEDDQLIQALSFQ